MSEQRMCVNCPGRDDHDTADCPLWAGWRDRSKQFAKGVTPPNTVETLQAAWDRDQELMADQKAEISSLKQKINQLRQAKNPAPAVVPVAYEAVDRLLRNTLDDDDYATYSAYLDELSAAPVPPAAPAKDVEAALEALDWFVKQAEDPDTVPDFEVLTKPRFDTIRAAILAPARVLGVQQQPIAYCNDYSLDILVSGKAYSVGVTPASKRQADDRHTLYLGPAQDVGALVEALEDILDCPQWVEQATVPRAGIEACPEQVVCNMSVGLMRLRKARAALAAHKGDKS